MVNVRIVFVVTLLLMSMGVQAQDFGGEIPQTDSTEEKEPFFDRLYYGGGFGASFGTITQVQLSPTVFYKATKRFHPGIATRYVYYGMPGYNEHIWGGSAIARYFVLQDVSVLKNVYIHAEQEVLNGQWASNTIERSNVHSTFLGGGALISLGGSFYMNASVLYRFNYNQTYNPYTNPVVRLGIIGGF